MIFADFVDWQPEVQITLIITLGFCFSVACLALLLVGYCWIDNERAGGTDTPEDEEAEE